MSDMLAAEQITLQTLSAHNLVLRRKVAEAEARVLSLEDRVRALEEGSRSVAALGQRLTALQREVASLGQNMEVVRSATGAGVFADQPAPSTPASTVIRSRARSR